MSQKRLDVLLFQRTLFKSREQATKAIKAGCIMDQTTQKLLLKPSQLVDETLGISIIKNVFPYVSRGGEKLKAALDHFEVNVKDKIVLDIGASTGGFTDCVLQEGAKYVYALDAGTNQLAVELQNDARIKSLEQTNFRYIDQLIFTAGLPEIIVIDVSFISLTHIVDKIEVLFPDTLMEIIALIKPQFEVQPSLLNKNGVVKNPKTQRLALQKITAYLEQYQWSIQGIIPAPITGSKGNQEFLLYCKNAPKHSAT